MMEHCVLTVAAIAALLAVAASSLAQGAAPDEVRVYIGTYTRNNRSQGIYQFLLDVRTGAMKETRLAAPTTNPSFLALHPNRRFLYAVGEMAAFAGRKSGAVSAFAIDPASGNLQLLNQQPTEGGWPCHLIVDPPGRHVLLANYGGGNVAVLPIGPDGRLGQRTAFIQHTGKGPNPKRQEAAHAHSINLDPSGQFAFVADLGLDKIMIYRFDPEKGTLAPHAPPFAAVAPGAGPRHFAFHPNGRFAYVINELDSTITAFAWDPLRAALTVIHSVSTLPRDFTGENTTAEVVVHPNGRFLYGSNRGHNSIAIFAVNPADGRLAPLGHVSSGGKTPRNFNVDPTGRCLLAANQDSDNVVSFLIDSDTGALRATGNSVEIPMPVCVKFYMP